MKLAMVQVIGIRIWNKQQKHGIIETTKGLHRISKLLKTCYSSCPSDPSTFVATISHQTRQIIIPRYIITFTFKSTFVCDVRPYSNQEGHRPWLGSNLLANLAFYKRRWRYTSQRLPCSNPNWHHPLLGSNCRPIFWLRMLRSLNILPCWLRYVKCGENHLLSWFQE